MESGGTVLGLGGVAERPGGGLVIGGAVGEPSFWSNPYDAWLLVLDESGDPVLARAQGGTEIDQASAVGQTSDGYVLGGCTWTWDLGGMDAWVLRVDAARAVPWEKVIGTPT